MLMANLAVVTLTATKLGPAPMATATVGPLLAGFLGGCGGAFLSSGSLDALNGGLGNWRLATSALFSLWMRALLDPTTAPYLAMAGFNDPLLGRAFGVFLIVTTPLVSMAVPAFQPLGANPLVAAPTTGKKKRA